MITGAQIRAARGLKDMTAGELATAARVGVTTVRRAEAFEGKPRTKDANLSAIRAALEAAGVEFIPENGGGAGVRFRRSRAYAARLMM